MKNCKPKLMLMAVVLLLALSCDKDKFKFVNNGQVYGKITYNDLVKGDLPVPSGQVVQVYFEGVENPKLSFKTQSNGKYEFTPAAEGKYSFDIAFVDSVLQYNADIAKDQDIDGPRKSSKNPVIYATPGNRTPELLIRKDNKTYQQDISLQSTTTALKLSLTDEQGQPVPFAKVCLYSNKSFAVQNAPYCAGCIAYLTSDQKGEIIYSGLLPQKYYVNARADIGSLHLNNQWSDDMKSSDVLVAGKISEKTIVLKQAIIDLK